MKTNFINFLARVRYCLLVTMKANAMKEITEETFRKDCERHGLKPWDFHDEAGQWRQLYLLTRRSKAGRRAHGTERTARVGVRVMDRHLRSKGKLEAIYSDLAKELNAIKDDPAFSHNFTSGSIKGIYEDYNGISCASNGFH